MASSLSDPAQQGRSRSAPACDSPSAWEDEPAVGDVAERGREDLPDDRAGDVVGQHGVQTQDIRSEEHTSELQSRGHLVCRLLLEKKKKIKLTTRKGNT